MHRPPLAPLVAYRLLGWRLGSGYQAWVYDDITRRGFTIRSAGPAAAAFGGALAAALALMGADPRRALPPALGLVVLAFFLRAGRRARALRQQGLSPDGDAEAGWLADDADRRRRNVRSAAATVVLVAAGSALLARRWR